MKFIPMLVGLPAILWFASETSWQAALAVYILNEKEQVK